jgi:hypothetical protein
VIFPKLSPFEEIWNNEPGIHQRKGFHSIIQEQANRQIADMD